MIGPEIEITVLSLDKYRVRLGITAPKDVPVHRQEVAEAIEAQAALDGYRDEPLEGNSGG